MTDDERSFCKIILEDGISPVDAYAKLRPGISREAARVTAKAWMQRGHIRRFIEARSKAYEEREIMSAVKRRAFVINGLVQEAETAAHSRDRIKALELLGKLHDVRAFTDGVDAALAGNRSAAELRAALAERLASVVGEDFASEIIDITPEQIDQPKG